MSTPADKRPTLKSLAAITGLGISTISLALRDSPEIAAETKKRVKLAAAQAGYRPNRAGVRLRTGRTNVITVVLNPQDEGSGFFADFVYGISEGLAGTQYHLVVTPYSESDPMEPIRYIVETNPADGVILSRTQPQDPRVRFLHENKIPFITHGRTEWNFEHAYHDYDNEAFAYQAVRKLKERGRKRIALHGPPRETTYSLHTLRGFERALRDFDLENYPLGSSTSDAPLEQTRLLGRELALSANPPDGIVVSGVSPAVVLARGLEEGGLQISRDFDIVSKYSNTLLSVAGPKIISIPEDFRRAGRQLSKMLIEHINGRSVRELQEIISPDSM